jgi:catechol 2,3-dioxygenase-like lactoylglutathione lyase family enzyme
MIKYTGINHLAMVTGDMDKTIAFWRDLLGMRLVAGLGKPGSRHYFFEVSPHDMIAFFEWPEAAPIEEKDHGVPVSGPVAFDHVSFEVESSDDLWAIRDKLDAAGFWVSEPIDHGFIHSIYTFDPNNIAIEFSVPVPEVDLRAHPAMKDSRPTAFALEGPDPQLDRWPAIDKPTPAAERQVYPGEGEVFREKKFEARNPKSETNSKFGFRI